MGRKDSSFILNICTWDFSDILQGIGALEVREIDNSEYFISYIEKTPTGSEIEHLYPNLDPKYSRHCT